MHQMLTGMSAVELNQRYALDMLRQKEREAADRKRNR